VLVVNADDARVMARLSSFPGRRVTFGLDPTADVSAADVEDLGLKGTRARIVTARGERELHVPLLGRGHLSNVLAAAAVALELDVDLDDIVLRAAALQPSPRRGVVSRTPAGVTVIDDSYNSSPAALKTALDVLARSWAARRIAVVGEMLELGDLSVGLHEDCGRVAAASGLLRLVTIGGEAAQALGRAAVAAGMAASTVSHFGSSAEAAEALASQVTPGDLVLVKGSRGTRTDVVVDRLTAVSG